MAIYTDADFGNNGSEYAWLLSLNTSGQVIYTNVSFPIDIKISNMGMQVGKAYGHTTNGSYVPPQGKFYGRYCIWDNDGNLLAQTNVVEQGSYYTADRNRPYTWSDFTSQPVLKKNTNYRIGFYATSDYSRSFTSRKYPSNPSYWRTTSVSRGSVDSGAQSIGGSSWNTTWNGYTFGIIFMVNYTQATLGSRQWDGGSWQSRGIKKWDGSSWQDVPLYKWNGSFWDEV